MKIKEENKIVLREVSIRFVELCDIVLANPKKYEVHSISQLTKSVGMIRHHLKEIRDDENRNITIANGVLHCKLYGFNANYLFLGFGKNISKTALE